MEHEQIHKKIGKNLQNIRKARMLSLDQVAELTGVSKAMLGQIERGDSNPTISIIWKIVNGLHISFTSLIEEDRSTVTHIRFDDLEPLLAEQGYRSFPQIPFEQKKKFEIYSVQMEPGSTHASEAHHEGVEEYILMVRGKLRLSILNETYDLDGKDALRFTADQPHVYENVTDEACAYYTLIYYPA
ncbi:helix-turn-helix domain-containing protein [Paenibacillus sacheonensis]|uniref:Helix-turn-helix domain-containing protein n=1 Tax=Paenibacillus sacheonensis TaxID=742054 RepID=A0A7X4YUS5_9BACL|nr:XRE family transcriptional regulator [Paenibacillus sacheonensis]MBM7567762.1 transcriptional regulator with XRE-family HTH domain [Paenibacillus sacheonensis]NBC71964.1 helix-turn-helix domain-containing protein [Paenibacillus sacheonensis]